MKKGKSKNNFLFIMGISVVTIILFVVGFVTFYHDSSMVFGDGGYIIYTTDKESASYSFTNGTKYKTDLSKNISFVNDKKKNVSVDSGSFVHYDNGSISFLQNGALLDLDKVNLDFVPYYNISNQTLITYEDGKYIIKGDKEDLTLTNWMGRVSDNKYIVAGSNLSLKIPGVTKTIEGDYFELIFMTNGVVKIDNKEVSYQVTSQDSYIYVGDAIKIDLGQNQIYYNNDAKMLISQITISGDENINLGNGNGGNSGGNGTGSGTSGGSGTGTGGGGGGDGSSTAIGSGILTSGTISGSGVTSGTGTGDGTGGSDGTGGDGSGTGGSGEDGNGGNGSGSGEVTTTSAKIELIKLDVTSTSMNASLQMNRSSLISGNLVGYLTNISTGERKEVNITKEDGTLSICSSGTDCYSFNTSLTPDNQYLLSIVDVNHNKQYFQKLITSSELGVKLVKEYSTSSSLSYTVDFDTNANVSQLDFYIYDEMGEVVYNQTGITDSIEIMVPNLKAYTSYKASLKNVSVCDNNDNCNFDSDYEMSRTDTTLKTAPVVSKIDVKKNVDSGSFDLSASVKDEFSTAIKYIYTICESGEKDEEVDTNQCIVKEKTDDDALNIKVGEDIKSGVVYVYTFKILYNDGEMDREVNYNGSSLFSMESLPYFQLSDKKATSNSISGKLSLVDPSCTVPIKGRICRNKDNELTLRYYKLVDGEEKKTDITIDRQDLKYDDVNDTYYYDLNLTNLASETKYVIKVYGTYYLNDEEFSNVQIGDEVYAETTSTGNLKFVYSDNNSTDDNIINFNARLGGGSKEEESEDGVDVDESANLKALDTISQLTFDLYAGSYADDSETNNRHLGKTLTITGNANIRKLFCNSDSTSYVCGNVSYNIINSLFGDDVKSGSDLMKATGEIKNLCTKENFGCLATSYTVVVKGYDKANNPIKIDNNTYTYNVTPSYYVSKQLSLHTNNKSISVDKIKKIEFKFDGEYNFNNIIDSVKKKLTNIDSYNKNLEAISDDTAVGIKINASIPQNYINAVYKYDKVVTNYYICNQNEENCNSETAINTYSLENTNYTDSNHTFYLDDDKFTRGNTYKIMYELVFTLSDGTESVFSNSYTIVDFSIERQAPIYNFYVLSSTKNTITYGYNIKDVDKALVDHYFYYKIGDNKTAVKAKEEFTLDTENQKIKIDICDDTCNGTKYDIYLNERLLDNEVNLTAIDSRTFDGLYGSNESDNFELITYNTDNRLFIKLNDDDIIKGLGKRTVMYEVILNDENSNAIYDHYYLASQLYECNEESRNNYDVCRDSNSNFKFITVDYNNKEVLKNINKNITVSIKRYYDNGLIGINQTFDKGLILQNTLNNTYLNIYGYSTISGYESKTKEDSTSNGVYMIDKSDINTFILYNKLGLGSIDSYSKDNGVDSSNIKKISESFNISYLSNGIKFGSYSNYDPKVIDVSELSAKDDNNSFKFDKIIPKVTVSESRGINSISLDFKFTSVFEDTLSSQFKNENGKYYLYVNLYDEDGNVEKEDQKVEINLTNNADGNNGTKIEFKDLGIKTVYQYDVWAYMKSGNGYNKVQVYDGGCEGCTSKYVKTTYKTSTLSEDDLLSKLVYNSNANGYKNEGESISSKIISYNVKVTNGNYMKIRLELYDKDRKLLNFDGGECKSSTNCYVEISDSSHSILTMNEKLSEYKFNNNNFVYGDGYYYLKVIAIPYYSDNRGYDESNNLTLYDGILSSEVNKSNNKISFDVHELKSVSFDIANFKSGYYDSDGYYIEFTVNGVTDSDYVMKNGEFNIILKKDGDTIYIVKNYDNTTSLFDKDEKFIKKLYDDAKLMSNSNGYTVRFPNLSKYSQYSIELSYDTYRNNVSFIGDDNKVKTPDSYIDYIYTPLNEGITLGNVVISKESNTSFKLEYIGSNNLNKIKRVDYKVTLSGTSTSGYLSGDSIFAKKGNNSNNYSLVVDLSNSNFDFKTSGTYIVAITYYTDVDGKNKIYSSTFSILV